MMRLSLPLLLICALAGCAGRPTEQTIWPVPAPEAAVQATESRIFVATTRTSAVRLADGYTSGRSDEMGFAEFTVSIPPNHVPGQIEWPKGIADPRTDFAVTQHLRVDRSSFLQRVAAADAQRSVVFVHGFNYSFPESLYRTAQMQADAQLSGAPVLFSWPSAASLRGYPVDQDSAAFSRDALDDLLTRLTADTGADSITVFGHSMGGWLVMEALRQMRLAGKDDALSRLEVILAAPDIDVDVFRQQMAVIGRMDIPLVVMVSPDDRALRLSGATRRYGRLGALDLTDPRIQAAARAANVTLVDISSADASTPANHDRYIAVAAAYPALLNEVRQGGGFAEAGTFVLDSAGQIITAPLRAVDATLGR
ncbi:alpha/beta hydrolase [Roseinatronobacter sp. S2]|uniref:alpha/beta hydrolase n=1 Tax=Roseinatronobacter sp. S2 TaxID=3035471 RepID=UPI00240F7AE4|nr:alpha/beta fold hydrolase [Roseinatronobacter sp. S2]WFE75812.1 alpha/beta fold hydrolase [Roseinatronobacter sp. S2]